MSSFVRESSPAERTGGGADWLFRLLEDQKLEGIEKSFKMFDGTLLANRFLLGVDRTEIDRERLFDICRQLGMPVDYLEEFERGLPDANLILFGFEENQRGSVYKVYLEFWDKITAEISTKPNKTDPVLLHLGFKWDPLDDARRTIARYRCYPLLSVDGIVDRLAGIYEGYGDRTAFETVEEIVHFASRRATDDSFVYLEVGEEGNPRRSFDVNLYKADLRLGELHPFLVKMSRCYAIPAAEFDALFDQARGKLFGHLAGGGDREGRDFLTIYFELS